MNDSSVNPMDVKRELARKIIELYYDEQTALKAENHFNTIVVKKGVPEKIPEYRIKMEDMIVNIVYESGLLKSKGEVRRMIKQGGVKLGDKTVLDINAKVNPGGTQILKIGKRRFLKVVG